LKKEKYLLPHLLRWRKEKCKNTLILMLMHETDQTKTVLYKYSKVAKKLQQITKTTTTTNKNYHIFCSIRLYFLRLSFPYKPMHFLCAKKQYEIVRGTQYL
jgi:hypothetical protein